eukprot:CAMPEP_0182416382 /NCGR_PEP_ID=MMETSP1167-20130531/653_1 /TAXON_ID=2988 /ORGANISM="Mallomonas Sp, Strain CCMP3275" /LENGTH=240 /DNA_ID=CAMNT_0024589093 /DNA_START=372 /DNA_END=1094 /DNA_ORIENTATION=-
MGTKRVVIFTNGLMALTTAIAVERKSDLALLKIIGIYDINNNFTLSDETQTYPYIEISAEDTISLETPLICVGQPAGEENEYDIIHSSKGRYEGVNEGDLNDNYDIGKLRHSCWTYWGHSGAPLLTMTGKVVGLHSSWDDETGRRHGIHLLAVKQFLHRAQDTPGYVRECFHATAAIREAIRVGDMSPSAATRTNRPILVVDLTTDSASPPASNNCNEIKKTTRKRLLESVRHVIDIEDE